MIKYNHPSCFNTWYVQAEKDELPLWAVNVQPYDGADLPEYLKTLNLLEKGIL